MKIEKFDELLNEYNSRLNKISKDHIAYKINLENATTIFFEKINKVDKNLIYFYIKNINKDNINKNEIQRDALDYLILLTVNKKRILEILENLFPEYLEIESVPKSSWKIIRLLQVFIAFFIKPISKLRNLIEARRILNVLRDLKDRLSNPKNDLFNIDNVDLERESYNALSLIKEKIFESKITSLIYKQLDEDNLLKVWGASYKTKLYHENNITISDKCKENADIDILIKYLDHRIKSLLDSKEKKIFSKELTLLKDLVYQEKFSLFEEKVYTLKKSIEENLIYNNAFKIMGIYNLIEGIKQRLKLICEGKNTSYDNSNHLTKVVQLLNLSIDKIQFYYECHRENLDKQYEFCFENSTNFYDILDHLEKILYTNKNLFFHFTNKKFDNIAYASLSTALGNLTKFAKELENCAQNIDPKALKADMLKLSQFILNEVLFLSTELSKEMENAPIIFYSDEESAVGPRENDEADSEWDDDGSDISDTLSLDAEQHPHGLGEESPLTNLDNQSDSGVSDGEEFNLSHYTLSNYPHSSLFKKTPIEDVPTINIESISQQI